MARVHVYYNVTEAMSLENLLRSNNIPVTVLSHENWGLDGIFRHAYGMGEIVVPDEMEDKAKTLIEVYLSEQKKKKKPVPGGGQTEKDT